MDRRRIGSNVDNNDNKVGLGRGINGSYRARIERRQSGSSNLRRGRLPLNKGQGLGEGSYGAAYLLARGPEDIAIKRIKLTGNLRALPPRNVNKNSAKPNVELLMLALMSRPVQRGMFPNFPLLYGIVERPRTPVALVVTERATGDLASWLRGARPSYKALVSCVAQCVLALAALRRLGFAHNDAHPGNFLWHSVPRGGHWQYMINASTRMCIENTGSQFVLWDPMFATQVPASTQGSTKDLVTFSSAVLQILREDERDNERLALANRLQNGVLSPLVSLATSPKSFAQAFQDWLAYLSAARFDGVIMGRKPADIHVLNPSNYILPHPLSANNQGALLAQLERYKIRLP